MKLQNREETNTKNNNERIQKYKNCTNIFGNEERKILNEINCSRASKCIN